MNQPEFTALQITILVRTHDGSAARVKEYFDSTPCQYQLQDTVARQFKMQLAEAEVDFDEVIVSIDNPAEQATRVRSKSSLMNRLLGRE